jgi:hypothetical protein
MGARTVHRYPGAARAGIPATVLDLGDWGPEWVFGSWHAQEDVWCRAAYDEAR